MFQIKWFRRLVRKYTNPIPEAKAFTAKSKLSILYMLCAWNAFGIVCYLIYTGRGDWANFYGYKTEEDLALRPAQQWAKALKVEKKIQVIRMTGLHKEQEYEYDNRKKNEEDSNLEKSDN